VRQRRGRPRHFDQSTHNRHAIRVYDAAGDLTRHVIYDQYFSQFSNLLTGAAVPYTQHNTTTDILAVPGDLTSATETTTGQVNFTVPHMGAVLLNARARRCSAPTARWNSAPGRRVQRRHRRTRRTVHRARGKLVSIRHERLHPRGGLN
jgi:hypothetical protein